MKLTCIITIAIVAFFRTPSVGADEASSSVLSSVLKPGKTYLIALPVGALRSPLSAPNYPLPSVERQRVTIVENIGAGWFRVDYDVSGTGFFPSDQPHKTNMRRALVNFAHVSSITELEEQPAAPAVK